MNRNVLAIFCEMLHADREHVERRFKRAQGSVRYCRVLCMDLCSAYREREHVGEEPRERMARSAFTARAANSPNSGRASTVLPRPARIIRKIISRHHGLVKASRHPAPLTRLITASLRWITLTGASKLGLAGLLPLALAKLSGSPSLRLPVNAWV